MSDEGFENCSNFLLGTAGQLRCFFKQDVLSCNPTIVPATNKLVGYTFDNAGNTKVDATGQIFTYDAENKQILVKDANGNTIGEYFYDGDGKRVKKIANSEETIFVYNANGQLIADYATQISQTPKVSYLTSDHLGSPRITTDANGDIYTRRDFMPFGEEIDSSHTSQRSVGLNYSTDEIRQKFTTYERDEETDLDFAQARMHNYNLGRFTSPDDFLNDTHLTDPASWNLYIYARNNPYKYVDPTGKLIWIYYQVQVTKVGEDGKEITVTETRRVQYRDGKLWTNYDKKEAYKGDNANVKKIYEDLQEIRGKGDLKDRLDSLANDDLHNGINHEDFGNNSDKSRTVPDSPGKKTGSNTYYDSKNPEDKKGTKNRTTAATLARELFGPVSRMRIGLENSHIIYYTQDGDQYIKGDLDRFDIDTQIREIFGLPKRSTLPDGRPDPGFDFACRWDTRSGGRSGNGCNFSN